MTVSDMKTSKSIQALLAGMVLCFATGVLVGCDPGDTNPVTPDKMEEIRKQEANDRGNFKPNGGPPPTAPSTGGTTGTTTG